MNNATIETVQHGQQLVVTIMFDSYMYRGMGKDFFIVEKNRTVYDVISRMTGLQNIRTEQTEIVRNHMTYTENIVYRVVGEKNNKLQIAKISIDMSSGLEKILAIMYDGNTIPYDEYLNEHIKQNEQNSLNNNQVLKESDLKDMKKSKLNPKGEKVEKFKSSEEKKHVAKYVTEKIAYVPLDEEDFSPEECERISAIAYELDISNPQHIIQFGNTCHEATSKSADELIEKFQAGIVMDAKDTVAAVVQKAQMLDMKPLMKKDSLLSRTFVFIKNRQEKLDDFRTSFSEVSTDFDRMLSNLKTLKQRLVNSIEHLNTMYDDTEAQHRELSIYIAAGQFKIKLLEQQVLAKLKESSSDWAKNDIINLNGAIDQLSRKIDNLRVIRISAAQAGPQIQVIMNTNMTLANNLQETEQMLIPLWKRQVALGMQIVEQDIAGNITESINSATDKSLRDTADLTKMSAIEAAQLINSGGAQVDIKTINYVQNKLVETMNELVNPNKIVSNKDKALLEKLEKQNVAVNKPALPRTATISKK